MVFEKFREKGWSLVIRVFFLDICRWAKYTRNLSAKIDQMVEL